MPRRNHHPTPRPFVKWAGGKRRLLPQLLPYIPERFGTFYEPFIGGGALFFELSRTGRLEGRRAIISDDNVRLIRTYRAVRSDVHGLIRELEALAASHSRRQFYEVRAREIDKLPDDVDVAAWFIYLNKTAYNGLYRVNKKDRFNAPIGSYKNPRICDAPNLQACAAALDQTGVLHGSFEQIHTCAQSGDFVYFDPPYDPSSKTASFTKYTPNGFTLDDQTALRDLALELKGRGVRVLISNSDTPKIRALYAEGFTIQVVQVARAINSVARKRQPVAELLIS